MIISNSMSIILNKYIGSIPNYSMKEDSFQMCEIIPPQTNSGNDYKVSQGYYCIVIDNSGSMDSPATVTTDDGDRVNHGWSILDIAKHAVNTFIQSLDMGDYVYIVSYSDTANVVVGWTCCNDEGKVILQQLLYSIRPDRATNMVAGLEKGFEAFSQISVRDDMVYHMLFTTDGLPSQHLLPVRGIGAFKQMVINMLDNQKTQGHNINITTLGLGNNLNSLVLLDICAGTGEFLHLTDPGCVGPFMVNLVAQCRTISKIPDSDRVATNMYLRISPATDVLGYGDVVENKDGDTWVPLKHLLYDCPRHIVVNSSENLQFGLYQKHSNGHFEKIVVSIPVDVKDNKELVTYHAIRQMLVKYVSPYMTSETWSMRMKHGLEFFTTRVGEVLSQFSSMTGLKNTLIELELGFSTSDNFSKWGRHYMRTLIPHLLREVRTNFRDEVMGSFILDMKGLEGVFDKESNKAETIFATMTAPPPSLLSPVGNGGYNPHGYRSLSSTPMVLPDEFLRGGGCFHPMNTLKRLTTNGWENILMGEIKPGDRLKSGIWGVLVEVKCVVKIACPGNLAEFVKLKNNNNSMFITPWHPIIVDGKWVFPKEYIGKTEIMFCPFVVNLVLKETHIIQFGHYQAVTLGHNFQEDIVRHEFWGKDVIKVLSLNPGWESGTVYLTKPLIPQMVTKLNSPILDKTEKRDEFWKSTTSNKLLRTRRMGDGLDMLNSTLLVKN